MELVDRLLECVPGAAAHGQGLQVALGDVAQAGRSVAVHASGFDYSFGLVRPFALGDVDGAELTLAAVVRAAGVSLPVLSADVWRELRHKPAAPGLSVIRLDRGELLEHESRSMTVQGTGRESAGRATRRTRRR